MTNLDVIKKIIGDISPCGDSGIDEKRYKNLKEMCDLVGELIIDIHNVSKSKESNEHSVRVMGLYADNFLNNILEGTDRSLA